MGVAAVVAAREVGELPQLAAGEVAVGHRDAEHRRVALDVEAVLQAQRAELVGAQFARQVTPHLVAELGDALVEQALVVFVVLVHVGSLCRMRELGPGRGFVFL